MFFGREVTWYLLFSSEAKAIESLPLDKAISIEVNGRSLVIARHLEGYFVTDEKCPHQGLPLSRGGFCEHGNLVCPFHRYSWDMKTGRESRCNEANMVVYPVRIDETGLFVGIEKRKSWFG